MEKFPVNEYNEKVVRLSNSALESTERAIQENFLNQLNAQLDDIKGRVNWLEINSNLEDSGLSDEEVQAVEYSMGVIRNLLALQNRNTIIERTSTRITDVALSLKVFRRITGSSSANQDICNVLEKLYNNLCYLAPDVDKKESMLILGGIMTDEELSYAKERASRINIK